MFVWTLAGAAQQSGSTQPGHEHGRREDLPPPYGGRRRLSHAPVIPQRTCNQRRRLRHRTQGDKHVL